MKATVEQYKAILDNMYDGVYMVDKERQILYWNSAAENITGFSSEKVVGSYCMNNVLNHVTENGKHLCLDGCPLQATMNDGNRRQAELYLHHADGHAVPVLVRTAPVRNAGGEIIGGVEVFSDNTSLLSIRSQMRRLEDISLRDPLTNLGNRTHLERRLNLALANYTQSHTQFGILFIDIDDFKSVNDTYGHDIGDNVLRMVANTLTHNTRSEDTAARWGGEEFIVILNSIDCEGICVAAEKLRVLIENSFIRVSDRQIAVTISTGVAFYRDGETFASLINRADRNMYRSKTEGRNRVTCDEVVNSETSP